MRGARQLRETYFYLWRYPLLERILRVRQWRLQDGFSCDEPEP
uniref:Uncharacterized protein n=1 Tax=Arundo donax TaxID=35708 RepID=A0A0A9AN98_ARUDO